MINVLKWFSFLFVYFDSCSDRNITFLEAINRLLIRVFWWFADVAKILTSFFKALLLLQVFFLFLWSWCFMFIYVLANLFCKYFQAWIEIIWVVHPISYNFRDSIIFTFEHFVFKNIILEILSINLSQIFDILCSTFLWVKIV